MDNININIKTLRYLFYASLVIVVLADFFIHREKIEFFWDAIPGFSALYGLVSSILLIIVSKAIGHKLLLRKEDYYD
ncbi:hypothetical protein ANME2D_02420 [Candidatus Methanoperedens nitroreducens]|uniref:Uncharacterized protein n=1 Tax=Candidatus Methanoperedens nitratireducens TaxID=1392998 RepID=A0A062V7C1_9EURY|nr:hypothetical protein [Candidatus Methanoperedens nitroreducens]KCZ71684.1 hypothetical protein ANME2D_02420 [Candidatus Methanoperedens nitroreducens]MDJ1421312.1 hypothetical protein [Candidatus Methanoperedens sp.]